jgi:hypothetical protein
MTAENSFRQELKFAIENGVGNRAVGPLVTRMLSLSNDLKAEATAINQVVMQAGDGKIFVGDKLRIIFESAMVEARQTVLASFYNVLCEATNTKGSDPVSDA